MRLLRRGIGLRMTRPHGNVAECQRLQDPSDTALIHRHEEARQDPIAQIAQPPAHNAIFGDIRPLADPSCELGLFLDSQLRGRTTAVWTIRQPGDPLLVVADDPVPQGLSIHAAGLGRRRPIVTLQHQCQRQKPPSNTGIGDTRCISAQ
jgi:hypothetical protein